MPNTVTAELDALLRDRSLYSVYQPVVDLDTGTFVAHEALLRGPAGPWASPLVLLAAAKANRRLVELERATLREALSDADGKSGGEPLTLFLNVEPCTLTRRPEVILEVLATRAPQVQVVVEITERALTVDLAGVLAGAEKLRAAGCAIALDDVGVEPESLALIPVLRPEVVKLDLTLLRNMSDPATLTVAGAVRAYAEASGAEVVAEGVETPDDLTRALALGATLGQGWLWGRGSRDFAPAAFRPELFRPNQTRPVSGGSPFDLIGPHQRVGRATRAELTLIAQALKRMALTSAVPPLVLATFEDVRFFTPAAARQFAELADRLPFVGALGMGMDTEPAPGVRGGTLVADGPLAGDWNVVVVGAHTSAALFARSLGSAGPDLEREFEFVVTYDSALVAAAAYLLITRLAPR